MRRQPVTFEDQYLVAAVCAACFLLGLLIGAVYA